MQEGFNSPLWKLLCTARIYREVIRTFDEIKINAILRIHEAYFVSSASKYVVKLARTVN